MAYGNNFYGGYNYGGYNYTNPQMQMQMQPQQAQQPQQQVYLPLTFVNGINEARMFIVQPNQTIYLRDNTAKDILYIKSVDSQGTPNIQIKRLVDVQEQPVQTTQQTQIDLSDYVTKEEFQRLEKKIEELGGKKDE